jgi:predicted metal-dependent phosphoesterase TrpH
MLGYFIDATHPRLMEAMENFQQVRQNRIRDMVGRLKSMSVKITADEVFELANCQSPGRPHIARVLVKNGVCTSLDDAFERFLKRGRPAWVPKFKISA